MNTFQLEREGCSLQIYEHVHPHADTAILFLHGGPGSGAAPLMQHPTFEKLATRCSCYFFDQRGSGQSVYDITQGLSKEMLCEDVHYIMQYLQTHRKFANWYLWGGSFGGFLAALCLENDSTFLQSFFKGIVLSSPAITFKRSQSLQLFHRMAKQYDRNIPVIKTSESEILPEHFFAQQEVRQYFFSARNTHASLRHICAMSDWFFRQQFPNLLEKVTIPVLIMQGKNDPICDYHVLQEEMNHLYNPNVRCVMLSNCGHEVFQDQSAFCIEKILQFIKEGNVC